MNRRAFLVLAGSGPFLWSRAIGAESRAPGAARRRCHYRGGLRRRGGGAGGRTGRTPGHTHRRNRLDRRPAHPAGRAARRTSLDRVLRLHAFLSPLPRRRPRLLPPPLSPYRRRVEPQRPEPRQRLGVPALPRAARRPGSPGVDAGALRSAAGRIRLLLRHKADRRRRRRRQRAGRDSCATSTAERVIDVSAAILPRRHRAGRPAAA